MEEALASPARRPRRPALTLRFKLSVAFALVAGVPLVTIEQFTARHVRREFEGRTAEEFATSLGMVASRFGQEGERVALAARQAARNYALRDALLAFLAEGGARHASLISAAGRAADAAGLNLLTLLREDGTVLATAQEPARFDVRDETAGRLVRLAPGQPVLAREEGIAVRGPALQVAVRLDEGDGRLWLIAGRLVDQSFLSTLSLIPSLALVVLSGDSMEIAPTAGGNDVRLLLEASGERVDAGRARRWLEAERFQVLEVPLPGVVSAGGTTLLLATSRRPLEAFLSDLERALAWLLLLGLGVAVALAVVISRRWTEPIEQLVRGLDRVAQGDLETRVDVQREDELGRLVEAFHAMTRDLSESRERLLQAERIAAWREIARRLAHEIKNPLSPIALSMETLRRAHESRRRDFPELLAECTGTVLEEVERLRRIVQEFSDFARLPRPQLVEESFHDVVRGVVSLHAGMGEKHRFVLDLEEGDGRFVFDPDQMNRLLVNLVKNAVEATPDGGQVCITTRLERSGSRFVLTVEDSGPGVSTELARSLFQPYVSAKPGGTGLGLAIAHRIAAEHGGNLHLDNAGEKGARFVLDLPLSPPAGADGVVAEGE